MDSTSTQVPAELERKMDEAITHYPADRQRSAALPLLHLWQEHFGFISDEGVDMDRRETGVAADQYSRTGHVLPDVPAETRRPELTSAFAAL